MYHAGSPGTNVPSSATSDTDSKSDGAGTYHLDEAFEGSEKPEECVLTLVERVEAALPAEEAVIALN